MPSDRTSPIAPLWDLVEESLDEAEFLWRRWEGELSTHARDLDGVDFWVEDRLQGSLDGVRLAGHAAHDILAPALDADDPFRTIAAAHVLATSVDHSGLALLTSAFAGASAERLPFFRRATELAPEDLTASAIEKVVPSDAARAALLLDVSSFQGRGRTDLVHEMAANPEPVVQAAVLRALRHLPLDFDPGLVTFQLGSPAGAVVEAAVETGLVLGLPAAWTRCRELASAPGSGRGRALLLLALLGHDLDQRRVVQALAEEPTRKDALFALGFAGTRAAAEACLDVMKEEESGKLAGEAFTAITGLDLATSGMIAAEPPAPDEPTPFEEDDLDADLVPKPEDLLPRPEVDRIAAWWGKNRNRFDPDRRYLRGTQASLGALRDGLERGPTRRRHATALELAVRSQNRLWVQTRAFCSVQRRQMQAAFSQATRSTLQSPLARQFSAI